ncbi:MAG: SET domain-containing protein [Chloroflexi bacterium]|nr:SET domain-containing protein [Chloroflexota bacterium]
MTDTFYSYLSPKLTNDSHENKGGCGVFAVQPIKKGELLVLWGGKIIAEDELDPTMPDFTQRVLQIEEGLYLFSLNLEPADCFNHSCDPNAGFTGQIGLVTMRDIETGEEICFDYAMCDGTNYDEFDCTCGARNCRKHIRGDDWKRPELWERYAGYFMPYLQRRIDALKKEASQKLKVAVA